MSDSRTKNTKRNIFFSYVDTFVSILFQFVSRTMIILFLGEKYLGLSSLYNSILVVLNMAELGFSSAIVFNLYRPLAEDDRETVCALLNYYRKVYRMVALVILAGGLAVSPLLPRLIKDSPPTEINIYLLYYLYLANTCGSYLFFAYKTALLNALQRLDLLKIVYTLVNLLRYTMQLISVAMRNYYLFTVWMILGNILKNLFAAYVAKKRYPQYECRGTLSPRLRDDITARVRGLLVCNISGVTYSTFDSIILSSMIGLTAVSIYDNYLTIFNGVATFIVLIRNSMQASVGNSIAMESPEKNYRDLCLWQFLFSFIAAWCSTCMLSLYQPFMTLWMGQGMLLPFRDVVLFCLWFYSSMIQFSYYVYLSGSGLWWEMRWSYVFSAVANLILNVVLGKLLGTTGILLATVTATFLFNLIWQGSITIRCCFDRSPGEFYVRQLLYFSVCAASTAAAFVLNSRLPVGGIGDLAVRGVVCTAVSVGVQAAVYCRTSAFQQAKNLLRKVLHSRIV